MNIYAIDLSKKFSSLNDVIDTCKKDWKLASKSDAIIAMLIMFYTTTEIIHKTLQQVKEELNETTDEARKEFLQEKYLLLCSLLTLPFCDAILSDAIPFHKEFEKAPYFEIFFNMMKNDQNIMKNDQLNRKKVH